MLNLRHDREVLMGSPNILEEILGKLDEMSLEEQDLLVELIKNRYREKRREDILANAQQTIEEYKKGLTSKGNIADLFKELEA
jgi:hypothetical protein